MALTTYILLERVDAIEAPGPSVALDDDGGGELPEVEVEVKSPFEAFRKIGAVNAHSTDQALRKGAEQYGVTSIVAVSERHWKSEEFEVETRTVVSVKRS